MLVNDIISRQDLIPWFACLHVNEENRNTGKTELLLNHSLEQANQKGFDKMYLSTNLNNFDEGRDWKYHSQGYGASGGEIEIYSKETK